MSKKLFCVINSTVFTDYVNLDLPGIFELALNLFHDFSRDERHLIVRDDLRLHHDAHLAPRLNGEGTVNALKGICNFLELFQPFDIILDVFTPCAGAAG